MCYVEIVISRYSFSCLCKVLINIAIINEYVLLPKQYSSNLYCIIYTWNKSAELVGHLKHVFYLVSSIHRPLQFKGGLQVRWGTQTGKSLQLSVHIRQKMKHILCDTNARNNLRSKHLKVHSVEAMTFKLNLDLCLIHKSCNRIFKMGILVSLIYVHWLLLIHISIQYYTWNFNCKKICFKCHNSYSESNSGCKQFLNQIKEKKDSGLLKKLYTFEQSLLYIYIGHKCIVWSACDRTSGFSSPV